MADYDFKVGDTEPITYNVGLTGESNLDNVSSAVLYARPRGGSTNHVDGATVTVSDSANKELEFDPVGNGPAGADAFKDNDDAGRYEVYTLITWNDGDTTRHPANGFRQWHARENFE